MQDEVVLAVATALQRAVLTYNRKHFIRLHRLNANHAGIVICTLNGNVQELAHRIDTAVAALATLEGCLIRIYRPA